MKFEAKHLTQTAPDDDTLLFIYLPLKDKASLESHPNCMDIESSLTVLTYRDVKSVGKC